MSNLICLCTISHIEIKREFLYLPTQKNIEKNKILFSMCLCVLITTNHEIKKFYFDITIMCS